MFIKKGMFIVIAEVHAKYVLPAFLGDELEISLEGVKHGRTSMTFRQDVVNIQSGKTIFSAELVAGFINPQGKPIEMEAQFKQIFLD